MERLILLRHGKAEQDSSSGDDFQRALTARGERDAVLIAGALNACGFVPDIALVSPAIRARQTWAAAQPTFPKARVVFLQALYNASPETLLARAQAHGVGVRTVMVVAHNPGLLQLALTLAHRMENGAPDRARLNAGFPTAAAAAFDLTAHTFALFTPKTLGGGW